MLRRNNSEDGILREFKRRYGSLWWCDLNLYSKEFLNVKEEVATGFWTWGQLRGNGQ
jgi:hypothetical protein